MAYKFIAHAEKQTDWKFEGVVWELSDHTDRDGAWYMDGGQFSIRIDEDFRSLSPKEDRQGIFVKI